jgi:hypothetical protein
LLPAWLTKVRLGMRRHTRWLDPFFAALAPMPRPLEGFAERGRENSGEHGDEADSGDRGQTAADFSQDAVRIDDDGEPIILISREF